jgi:hypothetical protein
VVSQAPTPAHRFVSTLAFTTVSFPTGLLLCLMLLRHARAK